MATRTFTVTKDATVMSNGWASGFDLHHPIGLWPAGFLTRALLYAPVSFAGMTGINSALLYMRAHEVAGVSHVVGDGTQNMHIRRKTVDWPETANHGENSWGSGRGLTWADVTSGWTTVDEGITQFGDGVHGSWYSFDITDIVRSWFNGAANYGVTVQNSIETDAAYAKEFGSRHLSGYAPYIWIDYSTNTAPNAPTSLNPTGDEVVHTGSSVTVSGVRSDPDSGDYISQYHIRVRNDALTATYYDQVTDPSGTPTTFSRTISGLPTDVFLRWDARTRDGAGAWGPWTATQRFKLNTNPGTPTLALLESPTTDVRTLTPTFKVTHNDADSTDTKAYKYQIQLETASGSSVWDSGEVSLGTPITTVSKLYDGPALEWNAAYRWRARTQDKHGQWSAFSSYATFTTHQTGAPVSLVPTGGAVVGGITPTLSGARASSADSLTSAQVQVYSDDGVTLIWDSGAFTAGVTATAFAIQYAGTPLAYSTAYKWRAQVTSSVGGVSPWTSLQSFSTPAADALQIDAPLGSGIADITPDFEFNRTDSFNAYQIVLYEDDGSTVVWDSGTVGHASATSKIVTYPGTPSLEWATTYQWKVRVSSDGGSTWGNGYTDLVSFTTEQAGVPDLLTPGPNAWLGAPIFIERAESLDGVTGSAVSTVTLDTVIFNEGAASFKAAIAALNGSDSVITVARDLDLSDYGDGSLIGADIRPSSTTNLSNVRLRFVDSLGAWAEYTVTPTSPGNWSQEVATKGSPVATSGTIDWSDVAQVVLRVTTSASATFDLWLDNIRLDATNPTFDGEATGGETIDTVRIVVYASDQTTEVWDSGDVAVGATSFSVNYAGPALVPGDTYYWHAQYTESLGPTGGFAALRAFSLNVAPNAPINLVPNTGSVVADDLTPAFEATFSDNDLTAYGDTPSMLEVEVYRNSDSVLMHTLREFTLDAGFNSIERVAEGTALSYEVEYKWRARYADSMGVVGAWSSFNVFKPSQSPTVAVTAPVSTISSPSFDVVWTFGSAAGKSQNRFRVTITRVEDEALVYDSGIIFSSVSSHTVPGGFLVNSTDYTIAVVAYDTDGLVSVEDTAAITSAWTAPDSIGGFSASSLVETSEILLAWDESTLDPSEFSYYQIYRREQGTSEWEQYERVTNQSTTQFSDYFAGHSLTYEFKITVWKTVVGDVDVESPDSEIPAAVLDPDAWFVIGADRDESHIFELPVADESHTEPIQQEVFEPLGSRRKSIVRGKVLGAEGTLQVEWTDSERRTAQTYLRYLADNAGPHILKSPFGDVWEVEFAGPGKKYRGGGHLGVTLTWIEVR